jgi:hypothetical protein
MNWDCPGGVRLANVMAGSRPRVRAPAGVTRSEALSVGYWSATTSTMAAPSSAAITATTATAIFRRLVKRRRVTGPHRPGGVAN